MNYFVDNLIVVRYFPNLTETHFPYLQEIDFWHKEVHTNKKILDISHMLSSITPHGIGKVTPAYNDMCGDLIDLGLNRKLSPESIRNELPAQFFTEKTN